MMWNNPAAVDIETTGLTWNDRLICISMAKQGPDGDVEAFVINMGYHQHANLLGLISGAETRDIKIRPLQPPHARHVFHAFLEGTDGLILQNGAFDLPYLVRAGILTGEELEEIPVYDTMVGARCTGQHDRVALDALLADYGIETDKDWDETKGLRAKLIEQPWDVVEKYSRLDAVYTLELGLRMLPKAKELYDDAFLIEDSDWVKLVSLMRVEGLQFDKEAVIAKQTELKLQIAAKRAFLHDYMIEGPNAKKSILKWIGGLGQTGRLNKTEKGNPQLDETSLRQLVGEAVPVVDVLLECRGLEKQLSTWVDAPLALADLQDRVHPLFTVSGARSNRLSCKQPNAQAFPKTIIKTLMSARPGYKLVALDLAQAELRIAASFAREKVLADEFAKPDADPHMATAKLIFGDNPTPAQRQIAKQVNFLSIYGGGAKVLVQTVNERLKDKPELHITETQARDIQKLFRGRMKGMQRTLKKAEEVWVTHGYLVNLSGKRVYASDEDLKHAYKAFDYLVQSSVAELIKRSMLGIKTQVPEVVLVNQVHDDIWAEVPDDQYFDQRIELMRQIMVDAYPETMREMTSPPITMKADADVLSDGLPCPETQEWVL
jgi:DNA polymerase I-like protein with 3'-5' exonuclease and polymerase domains